jgi:uncharacterized membrane protein YoaK (UPF0700 family)
VLIGLTVTTGLVDAISVLGLGGVFTANMTGNVVFLGFGIAGIPGYSTLRSIVALAAFMAGAAGGGCLGTTFSGGSRRRWLLTVASVEGGLLLIAALVALGYDRTTHEPAVSLYALIVLTAVAMGSRNATVRLLAVPDLTTTVLTLTLTGLAGDSSLAGGQNTRWGRRVASVLAIALGAAVGAVLVTSVGLAVPLALTAVVVLLLTIVYVAHPASKIEARRT